MSSIGVWIAAVAMLAAPRAPATAADDGTTGGAEAGAHVTAVRVVASGYGFDRVVQVGGAPDRLALEFTAERPTPGYQVEVESVRVDPDTGAIVARIVETPPQGMVAQVITRPPFSIALPELSPGTYAFRLERRRQGQTAFAPAIALTLTVGRAAS